MIDVVFIKPSDHGKIYGKLSSNLSAIEPPLWAALFAAYVLEKGYTAAIIDAEAELLSPEEVARKVEKLSARLVVLIIAGTNLSASTWNMNGASEYNNALKNCNSQVKTMFWGLHPSALPERTIREEKTDYVCDGEGFFTITELLAVLRSNPDTESYSIPGLWYVRNREIIKPPRKGEIVHDLDILPQPAWNLLPMDKYRAHNWHCFQDINNRSPYGVIYTSLGCPFNCSFCALKTLFEGKPSIRYRSPKKVIEDIAVLVEQYGVKNIKLLDECFVLKESHVEEICDLIIERGYDLNMWAYSRVDTVKEKMLAKMKQAGFNWLAYGIEGGSKKIRDGVAKGRYTQDDIYNAIQMTKDAGIYVCGNFMFGLPDDDLETMEETLNMAKELNCEYTNFYATMAYPGSDLYAESLKNHIPLPSSWRGYSQFSKECLPLPTKYLTSAQVLQFRDDAFVDFHSNPKFLDLIKAKFGDDTVAHIKKMLESKLERDILK